MLCLLNKYTNILVVSLINFQHTIAEDTGINPVTKALSPTFARHECTESRPNTHERVVLQHPGLSFSSCKAQATGAQYQELCGWPS